MAGIFIALCPVMTAALKLHRYFETSRRLRMLMRNHFINRSTNTPLNPVKSAVRGKLMKTQGFVQRQPNNWLLDPSETTKQ